jgi:hypothetical protein
MGWTETEQLLCVLEDGTVRMYNILGEYTQFSLGKVCKLVLSYHATCVCFHPPELLPFYMLIIPRFTSYELNRKQRTTELSTYNSGEQDSLH